MWHFQCKDGWNDNTMRSRSPWSSFFCFSRTSLSSNNGLVGGIHIWQWWQHCCTYHMLQIDGILNFPMVCLYRTCDFRQIVLVSACSLNLLQRCIYVCVVCVCVFQGDVQMSVTVLLVLGDRASQLVDELSMEHWFSSYIGRPPQNATRFHTRLFSGGPSLCNPEL